VKSNAPETAETINECAAMWAARIDAGDLEPSAEAELQNWLAGDVRRQGALIRLQAVSHMLSRGGAMASGPLQPNTSLRPDAQRRSTALAYNHPAYRVGRRGLIAGAFAACASLTAAAFFGIRRSHASQIETALGEIRRLPLNDGSLVAINTDTRLAVDMRDKARNVHIEQGEAWFEVAKDPSRPFTVAAGDIRVRAIGTAFAVQRLDAGADVQVTEGTVEIWSVGNTANRKRVTAGARTFATNLHGPADPVDASVDIDRALSWREGNLALAGDTLASAATQFNRYNAIKLEIAPDLREERIVGRFRTNEPEAFARAAAAMFGARVTRQDDTITISSS